jgi:uncharacterized repeat protein (TIGR03803 family)
VKKLFLLLLLAPSVFCHGQPKIVATLAYGGPKDGGGIVRTDLPGLTPGIIYSFDYSNPHSPYGGVCAGDGNWLYGMTSRGGANKAGAFYRIQKNGTLFTTLYHLDSYAGSSPIPYYHTDGFVYFNDNFFIRKYNTADGSINALPATSTIQSRNLCIDSDDWIYFVEAGFPSRLLKMKTDGSAWTDLHTFNAATEGDGGIPGVTEIPGDSLFGVQVNEGANGGGTLYSILKDGSGFTIHHQFTSATGMNPESKLIYFDGKLYGTTSQGGDFNKGVLFCINADGTNYRVLRHFTPGDGTWTETPFGNISLSSNGRIFGSFRNFLFTTNYYRLFKIDTSGNNFEPFFSGTGSSIDISRSNGQVNLDILLVNNTTIFFPTFQFGRNDGGALNQCDTSGTGSDVFHFGNSTNGFRPNGGVIKASDGKLYGTTGIGGPEGSGVIFSMNADGTGYSVLKRLTDAEGYNPSGKLLEASDGKLYGACRDGGANNSGCIFRLDKNGNNFQVIYSYSGFTGGYSPVGGLIEDNSGMLYGVNFWSSGSVFKINKNGSGYTELKMFGQGAGDLVYPYNGLITDANYLYGACGYGGANGKGGLFRIKKDGTSFEVLHEFTGADGELPVGTLLLASNGKLYGSTANGGTNGNGILFSIDITGSNFSVLRDLSNSDGGSPWTAMIQGSDGLVYGATYIGGSGNGGTIFKMNLDGTGFSIIRSLDFNTEGQGASSIIDLNGNFNPLPVQFITFTAQNKGQSVLLSWQTASEQNSDHFEIERSTNGNNFAAIGKVAAGNTTNNVSAYHFSDEHPYKGTNFYRLKEVDVDGTYLYSRIVLINFGQPGKFTINPNPVINRLIIKLQQGSHFVSASLFDASGRFISKQTISGEDLKIDVQHLPTGLYMLKLIDKEGNQENASFLKE